MKICFACSAGGHFREAIKIYEKLGKGGFFVTFRSPNLKGRKEKIYTITDVNRNPLNLFANLFQSIKILREENPDVIISTGAGVAVPICFVAKAMGKKIIYIDCGCNVKRVSLTGIFMKYISDLFIVQWRPLLESYPNAKYGGLIV